MRSHTLTFKCSSHLQCPACACLSPVGLFTEFPSTPYMRGEFKPWRGSKYDVDPVPVEDDQE